MDQYIHTELIPRQRELIKKATVVGRTKDGNGDVTGSYDPNTFLNTFTCDAEFSYSEIKEHSANAVTENMH